LPDIDIDVGRDFKPKVIEYLKKRWGEDKVAQMITFGRLQGKAALKEVFRAQPELVKHLMKVKAKKEGKDPKEIWMTPHDLCNEITKHMPDEASIADDLQEIRKATDNPDYGILNWSIEHIDSVKEAYKWYKPLFDQAVRIEGTKKNQSKHAAGVVIADKPVRELVPLAYDAQSKDCVVGVEMSNAEHLGAVKFDVLGVTALDKCWSCMEMINSIGEE
jgi:DNA polymerase-3 subunit alpha